MKPLTRTDALVITFRFVYWMLMWWVSITYIEMDYGGIRLAFFCAIVALAFATRVLILEWAKVRK